MKTLITLRFRPSHLAPLFAAAACLVGAGRVQAQSTENPPALMTYQGYLVDGNGTALATNAPKNYDVIFRVWDAPTGGNKLWAEQQTVTVDKGYFNVLLGEGSSIGEPRPGLGTLFTNNTASDRWIGITVKGIGTGGADADILPRLRLLTSPYAFLAQKAVRATTVDGAALTSGTVPDARLSGNVALRTGGNTFSGNQILNNSLGIGTASPGARLHILDNATVVGRFESSHTLGTWLALGNSSSDGRYWQMISTGSGNGEGAGKLLMGSGTGAGSVTAIPMAMQADGKIGVGTTSPAERLHVSGGNLQVSGGGIMMDNSQTLQARNAVGIMENWMWPRWSDNITYLNFGKGGFNIRNNASNPVMFMKDNGYVGIGTTSPGWPFTVQNDGLTGIRVQRSDGRYADFYRNNEQLVLQLNYSHWDAANRYVLYDGDANWDFGSDRKLKKDIVDSEPLLDRLMQVKIRRFRWKESAADSKHMLGVIAQELQPLFPESVGEMEDPVTKEKTLTVGYSDLGVIAVKALQELKKQHDDELADIRAELKKLAQENLELRAKLDQGKTATAAR